MISMLVILVALIGIIGIGLIWKGAELKRLMAVNTLFREDRIVQNFSNMRGAFLNRDLDIGTGAVSPLPDGTPLEMPAVFAPWAAARHVTSTLVLKNGAIVHQSYHHGTTETDLRVSWSMAKSYLSVLFGVLVDEGAIPSLDTKVIDLVPVLKGGAYNSARIIDVLRMSSGITFNEDYLDKASDINRMGRVLALGKRMDDFAAGLTDTFAKPGDVMQYTSIDTHVLGMVARAATGRDIVDLMSEKVISRLGLEATPYYLTDGAGTAFVLGGLNMTTRDYARFGQMILQRGTWYGQRIVSAEWVCASVTPSANTGPGEFQYGYQWWIPEDATPGKEVMARGIYGQYIYINYEQSVVVVITSADRGFRDDGVIESAVDTCRAIAKATGDENGT
ncbi:serine hydrolase [Ascidiaceihabitans sp.]|uniref:serine hydrolase domain-containing protein n=2 Tax=Ascidiaceihabitans sp. TaxID=1872644 RepID=UPI00329A707D